MSIPLHESSRPVGYDSLTVRQNNRGSMLSGPVRESSVGGMLSGPVSEISRGPVRGPSSRAVPGIAVRQGSVGAVREGPRFTGESIADPVRQLAELQNTLRSLHAASLAPAGTGEDSVGAVQSGVEPSTGTSEPIP